MMSGWLRTVVASVCSAAMGCGEASPPAVVGAPAIPDPAETEVQGTVEAVALPAASPTASAQARGLAWVVIAGGGEPATTELQIETDALAVTGWLEAESGGRGAVLFAGGAGGYGVAVQRADAAAPPLTIRDVLADIFGASGGRGRELDYRPHRLKADGPALRETALELLRAASVDEGPPLLVWLSGHGEQALDPGDAAFVLWGGDVLTSRRLMETLGAPARDVLVVGAMCHAGGFSELAFADRGGRDPFAAASGATRCALLATTWDRAASGCDPDPERQARESYARHLLEGLSGVSADGQPLPLSGRDLDGDGAVSWFEAHVRASVISEGFDVPTSTTARWLLELPPHAEGDAAGNAAVPPWDALDAGIAGLAERLGVDGDKGALKAAVNARVDLLSAARQELDARWRELLDAETTASLALRGELLARWAVLDDPWHPRFEATVRAHADAIADHLRRSEAMDRWQGASERAGELGARLSDLDLVMAPWLRLQRFLVMRDAYEALMREPAETAARRHFEALRRCEERIPPRRAEPTTGAADD